MFYDLTTPVRIGETTVMPIEIAPKFGLPAYQVRVTGPTGRSVKRARSFKGETAHMDAERYMGDIVTELRRSERGW
jgi:hypothetical protein